MIHALPFLRASARASRATANIVVAIVVGGKTSSCFLLLLLSLSLSLFLSFTSRAKPPDLLDIGRLYAKRRKGYRRAQNAYHLLRR